MSTSLMERFCLSALPEAELTTITEHLTECQPCHQRFADTLGHQRGSAPTRFTLAPEFWLGHEHVDFEQLVAVADNKLDAIEREIIDTHVNICVTCREDVRSFLAFRDQIEPELRVHYGPTAQEPPREGFSWWTGWLGLSWKPIYAAAIVLMGIGLIIGGLFLKWRSDNFEARQTPTPNVNLDAPQTPTPDNRAANAVSPPPTPNASPLEKPNSTAALVALSDGVAMVTLDRRGNISGLDDVPAPVRDEIAKVLLSERIERPSILKDLAGEESTLRGSNRGQSFKLISPARTVILSDQPTFEWERVSGASSYRVYVGDSSGHEVKRSEELSSEQTQWVLPTPLKRGEVYAWTVIAVVDRKEIVSPGPASPEMKFQILSASNLQQLNKLKKTRSHLALGVFYASAGMIAEAEREFATLVRNNPRSQHANKLIRAIQSWKGR
ncbi:MAG TPA: hypothetical protein VES69_10450 [Pyrinomonadaceae bacterium]|nr:hypothetical protein [Pyrinomonadaceae bacterium]